MQKTDVIQKLFIPSGKLREAMELYPGKTRAEVQGLLWSELYKKLLLGLAASMVFLVAAVVVAKEEPRQEGIIRPSPGSGAVTEKVLLKIGEEWKSLPLEVGALEYEEEQIEQMHRAAEVYLTKVMPGENESFTNVTKNLCFPDTLPEGGSVYWSTDAPWLVTAEGEVLNTELTEAEEVSVTAEISYGSEKRYFTRTVMICPAVYVGEEAILREVQLELIKQEQSGRTGERFLLPEQVLGYTVKAEENTSPGASAFFVLLAVVVSLLLYSGYFGTLDTKRKKRKEQAEGCYTEFITKLSLMLAAGVSVRQAFMRMAEEYEGHHGAQHVLAAELQVTKQELDNGYSETTVYEAFGRRVGVLAYRRMASLLSQNASKGVQGMRNLLLQEAKEVMAQERANIKSKGEQAGTKLLLPMMGMLFLVFAILLVPAFQSF